MNIPVITISREKGAGGRPVADILQQRLGDPWKIYDQETMEQIAKNPEMKQFFFNNIKAASENDIDEVIKKALGERFFQLDPYYQNLMQLIAAIGLRGNAIIVGRGANFLFPGALKIRLIAPVDQRVAWVVKYEYTSEEEAKKSIEESDMQRHAFIHNVFGHDQRLLHNYDLVIRRSPEILLEDAADVIVGLSKRIFVPHHLA